MHVSQLLFEYMPGQILLVYPLLNNDSCACLTVIQAGGQNLGGEVGYRVRFDHKTSAATRLVAMTEGLLVRRLQDDPFLEGVGAVLFDEFHERNLDADLGLAMVRMIQSDLRAELAIVVMSATLETAPLASYLGDCPVIESQGRLYPVAIEHRGPERETRLEVSVVRGVRDVLGKSDGDVLVFLDDQAIRMIGDSYDFMRPTRGLSQFAGRGEDWLRSG